MHADVCAATITWARDAEEERTLRRALAALTRAALPVVVADKGNSPAFTSFLRGLPDVVLSPPAEATLVGQVRASLRAALAVERPFVLYTEPDKEQFFERGLQEFLASAPRFEEVGIVLAARTAASVATFPPFQRYTEGAINGLWEQIAGEAADYSYGPMLIRRPLVRCIELAPPDLGWGWRHLMIGLARRLGYRVLHVSGDHPCPPDQYDEPESERLHRIRQLAQNVNGVVLSSTVPLPPR
jgi:hypothetical protein